MTRNIKMLVHKLSDKDSSVRRRAAEDLAEGDERAIYPLIKALSDENAGVQDAAMRSIIAIGGETAAYMVLPLLREGSYLRNTALIILTSLGEVSVSLLYPLLKDKDEDVRKFAADLLGDIKSGVNASVIVPLLKDPDANVRTAAARAIGSLGYSKAVSELINALDDEEWVCFYALEALGELKAAEASERIAELLKSQSGVVRFAAIETLGKLSTDVAKKALLFYLPGASGDDKNAIIKSLIQIGIAPKIGTEMSGISEHLITMLKEGDWEEKEIAIKGLSALNSRDAVPVMIDIAGSLDPSLPDSDEKILMLLDAISSIDSEDELLKLLDSQDIKYRGKSLAIEMLGKIRSKQAIFRLADYLNSISRDMRMSSAEALGEIGENSAIEPLLETSQKDGDAHVRKSAIGALGNIRSKAAFKPLMDLLTMEKYYDIIEKIVEALIKIDAAVFLSDISKYPDNVREIIARTVSDIDILLGLADDQNKKVKIAAIYRLGRAATDDATVRLISFLGDKDPDIRKAAVVALGETRYCPPELFNALHDSDPWVRFYTIKAIVFSCDKEKALDMINSMINDEFIPVIMSAIDAIVEIGGKEAYEALAQYEGHQNPDVRDKIKEAMNSIH
jgi:HEAT repeat protein